MRFQLPKVGFITPIFTSRFRLLDTGRYAMAQLVSPKSNKASGLEDPYRTIRASNKSELKPTDVLVGEDNRKYLIIDNGVSDVSGVDYKTFKALELPHLGTYSERTDVEDPITRRTKATYSAITSIWFSLSPMRPAEDKMRVPQAQYKCVTHYPIKEGARLNNDLIQRVENVLGVYEFWVSSSDAP